MTEHDNPSDTVAAALDDAGLAGLCREGRIELARDRLKQARPDLSDDEVSATVARIVAAID